jgi:tRNA (cmo5U34)-methyltransferase
VSDSNSLFLDMFSDRERIANYAEGPRRFAPGFDALHRMTAILLAERAPADAHVLVLGAGGRIGAHGAGAGAARLALHRR